MTPMITWVFELIFLPSQTWDSLWSVLYSPADQGQVRMWWALIVSITYSVQICLTLSPTAQVPWHSSWIPPFMLNSSHSQLDYNKNLHSSPSLLLPLLKWSSHSIACSGTPCLKVIEVFLSFSLQKGLHQLACAQVQPLFQLVISPLLGGLHQTICYSTSLLCPTPFPPQRAERLLPTLADPELASSLRSPPV